MSYQEKRTLTSMITSAAVLAAYCFYVFNKYQSGLVAAGDLKFWARNMLVFMGINIAAMILILIIFHVLLAVSMAVKETIKDPDFDEETIEKTLELEITQDEREKLVELKASRISFFAAGIGFIGALVSLLLNYSAVTMLNILYISFYISSLLDGAAQIYYYRKGV